MAVHLCFYPSLDISDINAELLRESGYINRSLNSKIVC